MAIFLNSIISTHRDRLGSLRAFLCAMRLASLHVSRDSFEVVITDLGEDNKVDTVIKGYQDFFTIKHLKPKYKGIFWKTKALNHCVLNSNGNFITMLDIDALVQPNFLASIEEFFQKESNHGTKLAHRVRFLDNKHTKQVTKMNFDEAYVMNELRGKCNKFMLAYERYTSDEKKLRGLKGHQRKWYFNKALGCSHFTMKKEHYMAIGGYDESFIGWACEDMDFNRRAFAYLGRGTLRPDPEHVVFSVSHNRKAWMNPKTTRRNEKLYASNKKKGIIKIPRSKNWGIF